MVTWLLWLLSSYLFRLDGLLDVGVTGAGIYAVGRIILAGVFRSGL